MAGTAQVYAIFWEPTGSFVSANYNSLILRYFGDVGSTGLYANNTQYTDSTGAAPSKAVLAGSWVDTSAYSSRTLQDSDIQNEVTNAQNVNGWTSDITHVFFVFTAQNETICSGSECSFTTFCGYHSFFGTNTIYAAMPYVGGVQGCNTPSSPNNDDADSTINVASHEQMESATDPLLNAWTDASGQEIGDKCNFTFATRQVTVPMSVGTTTPTLSRKNGTMLKTAAPSPAHNSTEDLAPMVPVRGTMGDEQVRDI